MKNKQTRIILLVLGIVLSCTLVYSLSISPSLTQHTLTSISEKKETVLKLTAGIASIVLILSFIPGDATKSIAAAFTNLTGYLLIITAALFLEKYMVTFTGMIAFRGLVPLGLVLILIDVLMDQERFTFLARRMIAFALCLYALVPATMGVADLFQSTYDQTLQSAMRAEEDVAMASSAPEETVEPETEAEDAQSKDPVSFLTRTWNSFTATAGEVLETISELPDSAKRTMNKATQKFDLFVESIAIMIVTTCLLPILVLLLFSWLMKLFFNVQIPMPAKIPKLNEEVKKLKTRSTEQKKIEHKEDIL